MSGKYAPKPVRIKVEQARIWVPGISLDEFSFRRDGHWIIAEKDGQRIYIVPPERKRTGWRRKLMGYHWSELQNGDMAELNALPFQGLLLPIAFLIYAFAEYGWLYGLIYVTGVVIAILLLFAIYDKFLSRR